MNSIIVTSDFTKESRSAVNYAARLALLTRSELLVLHATNIPVVSDAFIDVSITLDELDRSDKEKMDELVRQISSKYGPALKIKGNSEIGLTTELLEDLTESHQNCLVVMGMKHVDRFTELLFGSTSTDMVGRLNCPLMIIPQDARFRPWKKIAFAFDDKDFPTDSGVSLIKGLEEKFESKFHYIHIIDDNNPIRQVQTIENVKDYLGQTAQVHFVDSGDHATVEALEDWVRRYKCNVLVMVARKHTLLERTFKSSHSRKMAFKSAVPLLILSENNKNNPWK